MTADEDSSHYPSIAQLTASQKKKISQLREAVKEDVAAYPDYDTDLTYLRWLAGYDYDMDTIVPRLKWTLNTHRLLDYNFPPFDDPEEINDYIRELNPASEYFPGGVMGLSARGDVVYVQAVAGVDMGTVVKAGPVSELFRLVASEMEAIHSFIRWRETTTGQKIGARIIVDLAGFSKDLLNMPVLKIYMNLLDLMQKLSPDMGRCIYVLNAPGYISATYSMMSAVLSAQTKKKVQFLDKNWKEVLCKEIGPDHLLTAWGGRKKSSNGLPTGKIRMGGVLPTAMWYTPIPIDDDSKMDKITVGARTSEAVKVNGKAGSKLKWIFKLSSGDIDFFVLKDGAEAWPKMRLSTEFVPEFGSFTCQSDGEYSFVFDNGHGKIFSKDVKYRILLE